MKKADPIVLPFRRRIGKSGRVPTSCSGIRSEIQYGAMRGACAQHLQCAVGGTIVHNDDFVKSPALSQQRIELLWQKLRRIVCKCYACDGRLAGCWQWYLVSFFPCEYDVLLAQGIVSSALATVCRGCHCEHQTTIYSSVVLLVTYDCTTWF